MKIKQTLAFVLLMSGIGLFGLISAPIVSATETCGGAKTTIIKCDADNSGGVSNNGIWALLLMMLNILTAGVGIIAVGGLVYGSILYTTAEDKADQVKKATDIITNVVIGLILFALMWAGLNFIVPGGVFTTASDSTNATVATPESPESTPTDGSTDDTDTNPGGSGGNKGKDPKLPTVDDINLRNFRDASTSSGDKVLKDGVLFRSMALGGLGPKDAKELGQLMDENGLIIDLRLADQRAANPDKDVPGAKNINIPIGGVYETGPMVTDPERRTQLGKALKAAANAKGPVLIHCAAGKDRTGWMVAMIMYAAGATDAQVMKEYLKSNEEPVDGGVKAAWLKDGLQAMRAQYKTPKGYLKATGLSDADIKKLAQKFGA